MEKLQNISLRTEKTKTVTVNVTEVEKETLRKFAKLNNLNVSGLVRKALWKMIDAYNNAL